MADIIIENKHFRLVVGDDAISKSLVVKATGEECLIPGKKVALFSLTEKRPFNNELKLAYPNKRMTFEANSLRRDGNKLNIGFEMLAVSQTPVFIRQLVHDRRQRNADNPPRLDQRLRRARHIGRIRQKDTELGLIIFNVAVRR